MAKTAVVKARIEPELKAHAEAILEQLGLTPTQTITLLYKQIFLHRRLPFEICLPLDGEPTELSLDSAESYPTL